MEVGGGGGCTDVGWGLHAYHAYVTECIVYMFRAMTL